MEPSGYKQAKNGRLMFFCTCAECGITKTKFVKKDQDGGFLDITGSHTLGEIAAKTALKGLYNASRLGASKAINSDFAKKKIKGMVDKYIDQALNSFTSDLFKKLNPLS